MVKPPHGRFTEVRQLLALPDGAYAALTRDPNKLPGPQNYWSYNLLVFKLTARGDSLRAQYLGDDNTHEDAVTGNAMRPTTDGGLAVWGYQAVQPSTLPRRGLFLKLDSAWQEQWRDTLRSNTGSYNFGAQFHDAAELANGHFLQVGFRYGRILREITPPVVPGGAPTPVWSVQPGLNTNTMLLDSGGTVRLFGSGGSLGRPDADIRLQAFVGAGQPATLNYCAQPPVLGDTIRWTALGGRADSLSFRLDSLLTQAGPRYGEVSRVTWDFGDGSPLAEGWQVTHRFAAPQPVRVRVCVTNNLFCRTCREAYPFGRVTGRPEAEAAQAVRVFPNPSETGHFTVQWAAGAAPRHWTVTDALGRQVQVGPLPPSAGAGQGQVDLSGQPAGVYGLRLTWPDGRTAHRRLVRW